MTCQEQDKTIDDIMELLIAQGFDGMAQAMSTLINEAMRIERAQHLNAAPWERSDQRTGYANGYKPKQILTRLGTMDLQIPQTRDTDFYPASLERGLRSERALKLALAQMYVQGVSTRKVAAITEELCGFDISSTQVSRAAAVLDEQLSAWRDRPLGSFSYVVLDARYEKVRHDSQVVSCAVLIALGIDNQGKRQVLGCSVSLSEHEVHWRDFLNSLKDRGLHGVRLFISDAHRGIQAAREAVFPSVPWQRCQFHLQQNAQQYVPRQSMKKAVAADIRAVFNAPDEAEAKRLLDQLIQRYEKSAPKLSQWAQTALPQGMTVFGFAQTHQKRIRTSNMIERVNKEIRRRTRVATLFPNEDSCLRLVSADVVY